MSTIIDKGKRNGSWHAEKSMNTIVIMVESVIRIDRSISVCGSVVIPLETV